MKYPRPPGDVSPHEGGGTMIRDTLIAVVGLYEACCRKLKEESENPG